MQPTLSSAQHAAHTHNTYSNWFSWLGWLSYSFQRVSLANVHTRLLYLSGVSLANVLVGACLYRFVSGKAFSACLVKTYAVLFRAPGVGVFNEDTLAASLVLNLMFIFGLFVFACLLGMITDEIKLQLHAIRAGEVKLPLRDHVVVLNWNRQALSLLKQLSHAQADSHSRLYKRPIVVLAEPSKPVLDAAVAAVFKGSNRHQLRVFCRSGQPSKARDLERVAAEAAHAVILLHPDGTSKAAADALKAQTLISLTCLREQVLGQDPSAQAASTRTARLLRCISAAAAAACRGSAAVLLQLRLAASRSCGRRSRTSSFGRTSSHRSSDSRSSMRIVVQTGGSQPSGQQQEPDVIGFLQEATASSLHNSSIQQVQLLSQSTLDRLVCQTAAEPGVATVFRELVRTGGDVRLEWCDVGEQLAGSYGQAAGMLQDCVLLGLLEAESKSLTLNPPDHLLLQPGDRLVALTRQGILNTCTPAASTRKHQHPALLKRTVSRVSSMASPQLAGLTTTPHSSDSGGSSSSCSSPTAASRTAAAAAKPDGGGSSQGQHLVVLGWTEAAVPELLLQLQEALPLGSSVTVLLPLPAAGTPMPQQQQQQEAPASPTAPRVQYMRVADPGSVQSLLGAGVADADAVMLGPALSGKAAPGSIEADALVTSTVLAIQQALQTVSGVAGPIQAARSHLGACWQQEQQRRQQQQQRSRLHVVAVVSSYSVRRALQTFLSSVLLRVNFSYEICLMEEFAAGMLVSVALEVANSLVIDQLLLNPRAGGLGIWSLHKLGLQAADSSRQQLTWADVSQAARQCRCTALGYRRADGRMVLVPSAFASIGDGVRVVVLEGSSSRGSRGGGAIGVWK